MKYFIYARKSSDTEDAQVLSLESQRREMEERVQGLSDVEITGVYEESRTARTPGRPLFNEMLRRIELGEAEGIIAWHPDRLARNSVDGGRVVYLLDTGALKDLKFGSAAFENSPQGKFMLTLLFGYSKYYVDQLSENIRRGNRTKREQGWLPGIPPIGYLNDLGRGTIVEDPDRFELVRRAWELLLSGTQRPYAIWKVATHDWKLRTKQRRRSGGAAIARSSIYKVFRNPFYAGVIRFGDRTYRGRHRAMVSEQEFARAQELLGQPRRRRARALKNFPYRSLIRCGECGFAVTPEEKRNRYGRSYLYYHCSHRRLDYDCRQRSIEARALEEQLAGLVRELAPNAGEERDGNEASLKRLLLATKKRLVLRDGALALELGPEMLTKSDVQKFERPTAIGDSARLELSQTPNQGPFSRCSRGCQDCTKHGHRCGGS